MTSKNQDPAAARDAIVFIAIVAVVKLLFHLFTNARYGFHRDELQTLDDARHLAWGFVAYPPLTPFLGRIELALFGTSLTGFRFLSALAQSVVIVLAALIAKRLGGGRAAQVIAAAAVAISPVSLAASSLFQYVAFDILWWVAIAFFFVMLIDTADQRWWLAIGAAIGLGVMTKYTIAFFVAGIVAGVLLTPLRAHLRSRWLWAGVVISLVIAAPNLLWQYQHDFISLEFLRHIHERDVRIGRAEHFFLEQLFVPSNLVTIPLWIAGLSALLASPSLRRFRILAILAVVPFLLFAFAKGRAYYTAPLYVWLNAAGAVFLTGVAAQWSVVRRRIAGAVAALLFVAGSGAALISLPLAPIGSGLWKFASRVNGDLREEIGWQELTAETARVWSAIPLQERSQTAIFCGNYGEAGALNLYGPAFGLPRAISGTNSFWDRGYDGDPKTVIVLGEDREDVEESCNSVELAGHVTNRHGVENEESGDHPDIFICRDLKYPWREVWARSRSFG